MRADARLARVIEQVIEQAGITGVTMGLAAARIHQPKMTAEIVARAQVRGAALAVVERAAQEGEK